MTRTKSTIDHREVSIDARTTNQAHRRMFLVDLENCHRTPSASLPITQISRTILQNSTSLTTNDQVVVACNHDPHSVLTAYAAWGASARIVTGMGPSGADRALLEVMKENLENRFTELVLVSGDGIFADRVAALASRGLPTRVVAHSMGLSRRLRMAATTLTILPTHRMPHTAWKQGA